MNNMKFHKIDEPDFKKLIMLLDPEEFLKRMINDKMIDRITINYGYDVTDLCKNACAWALYQLRNTYFFHSFEVVIGHFEGQEHHWLQIGDYYIDLTLAQFADSPKLAITKANENDEYELAFKQTPEEYIKDLKL